MAHLQFELVHPRHLQQREQKVATSTRTERAASAFLDAIKEDTEKKNKQNHKIDLSDDHPVQTPDSSATETPDSTAATEMSDSTAAETPDSSAEPDAGESKAKEKPKKIKHTVRQNPVVFELHSTGAIGPFTGDPHDEEDLECVQSETRSVIFN